MADKKDEVENTKEVDSKKPATKMVPAKKLPKLFKKEYSKEKFEKNISKKLFIEPDRLFVEKLFEPAKDKKGNDVLKVDLTKEISKTDLARYKSLASQIKSQKFGIKIVPLIAVVVFISALAICFTLFKNVVLKKALVSTMQNVFQARTDIDKVDFKFFDSYINILNVQQANKDSPMKNLFQIDKILVDFNLTDLCRGKVHVENITVEGVALDTDRKTSGELSEWEKKKASEEEEQVANTAEDLKKVAQEKLLAMFESYNPEKMIADLQDELQSPKVANEIASDVQEKVTKWEKVPGELQKEVTSFSKDVEAVLKTNWGGIKDVTKLKSALETLNKASKEGTKLKESIEKTSKDIQKDSAQVLAYEKSLESAIKADVALVDTKITEMRKLFSPEGIKEVMNDAVQSAVYSILGKYYPYIEKFKGKAMELKSSSVGQKAEEIAKNKKDSKDKKGKDEEKRERLPGRMVYYKADKIPTLFIEQAVASGYEYGTENLLFKGNAVDVSNNPDLLGKPAKIQADFKVMGHENSANVVIDARKDSKAPLVSADYMGKAWPIAVDASVFSFDSKSDIKCVLTGDQDGSYKIGGSVDMSMAGIKGMTFEPERISTLYSNALAGINSLSVGFTVTYDNSNGVGVSIDNLDQLAGQLVTPITAALTSELNVIASEAKTNVTQMLSEKTGIATDKIAAFTDIQGLVNNQKNSMDSMQKQIDSKKKDLEKQIKNAGTNAAKNAAKDALKGFGF